MDGSRLTTVICVYYCRQNATHCFQQSKRWISCTCRHVSIVSNNIGSNKYAMTLPSLTFTN